jgi:hypothetical protein
MSGRLPEKQPACRFLRGLERALSVVVFAWPCLAGGAEPSENFRPVLAEASLDRDAARPGETVYLSTAWFNAGNQASGRDLRVLVHARLPGRPEDNSYPMFGGDYSPLIETHRWHPGRFARDTGLAIRIPSDARPGRYALLIGLYDETGTIPPANASPAQADFGRDRFRFADVTVLSPAETQAGQAFRRDFAALPAKPPQVRPRGAQPGDLVLAAGEWRFCLATNAPILRQCSNVVSKISFGGGDADAVPLIEICHVDNSQPLNSRQKQFSVEYRLVPVVPRQAAYHSILRWKGVVAVEMEIGFSAETNGVRLELRRIREHPPFQLMTVAFPSLISLGGEVPGAALVSPVNSGRLIPIATAGPKREWLTMDWFTSTLVAMAQQSNGVALLEPGSPDDSLRVQVEETGLPGLSSAARLGSLGVRLTYRLNAKDAVRRVRAQENPGARLTYLSSPGADWVRAAKHLRARRTGALASVYRDAFVYKIYCDEPNTPKPSATFEQALALIQRIAALTDKSPQVAYLVGWQYQGHDTGYPAVDKVNERLGGLNGLKRLIEEARTVNCIVSAHDNYDDAYLDSPGWNEDFIAQDSHGRLTKGGIWAGGQSYIISPARYANTGKMQVRVRDTLDRYPFRATYHIDVLSAVPVRHDFHPDHPAGATESLQGKLATVRAFADRGVDISSEGLTAPFVGPITYFWNLQRGNDVRFQGETRIPLAPFLYHGSAGYGGNAGRSDASTLEALLYGAGWSNDLMPSTSLEGIMDRFYFVVLPWQKLNTRRMESYQVAADGTARVGYDANTWVEAHLPSLRYQVKVDGAIISENFRTVAPMGRGRWLAYARDAQTVPLPGGATRVFRLSAEGPTTPVEIANGAFAAAGYTPYLLKRD